MVGKANSLPYIGIIRSVPFVNVNVMLSASLITSVFLLSNFKSMEKLPPDSTATPSTSESVLHTPDPGSSTDETDT